MKCPKCNGRGTVGYFHIDHFADIECDRCHGSGEVSEVEMTNEELMRTCSTEELATVIYGIAVYDTLYDRIRNALVLNPCEDDSAGINEVMKWLKEKHHAE